ncbi:MAG: hypothetical protein JNM90_05030 [Burkholderiales bacterium]|nr:hypothetical protein [Burkholderiales bacterium]
MLLILGSAWIGLRLLGGQPAPGRSASALIEARHALIAATAAATAPYVLIAGVNSPGRLPSPDFLDPAGGPPNVYDGIANGACARSTWAFGSTLTTLGGPAGVPPSLRCFGRLPWASLGLGGYAAVPANDPLGQIPWYAMSANLTDACINALNPGILNTSYAAFATGTCDLVTSPSRPFPWITVRDPKGNLLTDRAAAVLILPGPPLAGQTRPASPMRGPASYLDTVTVTASCAQPCVPGTYDNARFNWPDNVGLSFIQCAAPGKVPTSDPSFAQPYNCNDTLVYITIDELMEIAERRVGEYVAGALRAYFAINLYFPYAAPLSQLAAAVRGQCESGVLEGLVPGKATTGANPGPCGHPEFAGSLLGWFNTNLWGDYLIYKVVADCTQPSPAASASAECGGASGVRLAAGRAARALVVGAGAPIAVAPFAASRAAAQTRPSAVLADYLDSVENTNGDTRFDPPTAALNRSYNDKTVVVAP